MAANCIMQRYTNGNLYITLKDIDLQFYYISIEDNKIILRQKHITRITELSETANYNFRNASITRCEISGIPQSNLCHNHILEILYNVICSPIKIIKATTLNIELNNNNIPGYKYYERYNMSIGMEGVCKTLREIFTQTHSNNIQLDMTVKLVDDRYVRISFNCGP